MRALSEGLLGRFRSFVRIPISDLIAKAAADLNVELPVSADHLAVAVLALSNGLAIESLADPESVPPELFGTVLNRRTRRRRQARVSRRAKGDLRPEPKSRRTRNQVTREVRSF